MKSNEFSRASIYETIRMLTQLQRREDVRALPNGHERGYRDHERVSTARGHGWKP